MLKSLTESSSSRGEPSAKRMRGDGNSGGSESGIDKYKRHSKELSVTLLENLKFIWSKIQEQPSNGGTVEVEIRLGMLVGQERRYTPQLTLSEPRAIQLPETSSHSGLEFKAGVDESHMQMVKSVLTKKGFEGVEQSLSRLRVNDKGMRWEVGGKNNTTVLRSETKRKFYQADLALLCHEYDIRINGAMETPTPASSSSADGTTRVGTILGASEKEEDTWTQQRLKRRTSYSSRNCAWRVDVTDVEITHRRGDTTGGGGTGGTKTGGGSGASTNTSATREMEVEIELDAAHLLRWSRAKGDSLLEDTSNLTRQLVDLLSACIPSSVEPGNDKPLELVTNSEYKSAVRDINQRLKNALKQESLSLDFIGSMPVNLTRKNLVVVMSNNYYVTEKTDGVRYMMYIIADPARAAEVTCKGKGAIALLQDRKGALYRVPGSTLIANALGIGTVLDGEIVYNRTYKKNVFLMFDVLSVGFSAKLQLSFSSRIDIIEKEVNELCRIYLEAPVSTASISANDSAKMKSVYVETQTPLWLIRKLFRRKSEIGDIVCKMRIAEGGEHIYYENDRRHHKSDGIIFQPDTPYVIGTYMDMFKWKWIELRSVDLQAVSNPKSNHELRLFAGGPENTEIDCMLANTVALAIYDTYRLRADMAEANLLRPIIEVTYDTRVGTWRYRHIRKDKREPNKIQTIIGVMLELAEQIPIEELEYSFLSGGISSDFPVQLEKMKSQLLGWKKKK